METDPSVIANLVAAEFTLQGLVLTPGTLNYAVYKALCRAILGHNLSADIELNSLGLDNRTGSMLDSVGAIRGIPRKISETDTAYRTRLGYFPTLSSITDYYKWHLLNRFQADSLSIGELGTPGGNPNVSIAIYALNSYAPTVTQVTDFVATIRQINDIVSVSAATTVQYTVTTALTVTNQSTKTVAGEKAKIDKYFDSLGVGDTPSQGKLISLFADISLVNATVTLSPNTTIAWNAKAILQTNTLTISGN